MLRAICDMIACARQATIRFDGAAASTAWQTEDIVRRGIAHVPDGRGTFVHLTVEENLELGAYTRRDRAGVAQDFERVFGYFPRLKERIAQQAGTLSGGEQQMLAIARALMLRPRLLLLDEPSFGLAPLIVQEIFRILRRINAGRGRQHPAGRAERQPRARSRRLTPICSRPGASCMSGTVADRSSGNDVGAPRLSGVLSGRMEAFLHQLLSGLATGGIYASIGARAGDDLPGDASRQFRAGRAWRCSRPISR